MDMSLDGSTVDNGASEHTGFKDYTSPFSVDNRPSSMVEISAGLHYQGSIGGVLDELEQTIIEFRDSHGKDTLIRALHPPRLIRGLIDYKVAHPDMQHPEVLIEQAAKVALDVYQNDPSARDQLQSLRTALTPDMLTSEVKQTADLVSFLVTTPEHLERATRDLRSMTLGGDIVMIILGHGGVPGGLDIFSRYTMGREQDDSVLYPVRFSQHKHGDTHPAVADSEIAYLKDQARGKHVIVFDEDRGKSRTLDKAGAFFEQVLGKPVQLLSTHQPQNM